MPRQHLALEAGEPPRLELEWGGYMREFEIYLDGNRIGRIDGGQAELKQGRDFDLPDGSTLTIRLARTAMLDELQVLRDGKPLPGSAANPRQKLKGAVRMATLWGVVEAIGGIALLITGSSTWLGLGFSQLSIPIGLILFVCAVYLSRWSTAAAWVAIITFLGAMVYGGIGAFSAENTLGIFTTLAILLRFLSIPSIALGIVAVKQLQKLFGDSAEEQ